MNTAEADRRIRLLEERYFQLHRLMKSARAGSGAQERDDGAQSRLESDTAIKAMEQASRAILTEIEMIEDALLD
jgi:hypothetical protein